MSNIKELCDNVSFNRLFSWKNIPKNRLNNAIQSLGINNDEVILFYDSSFLDNGKTGLAICDGGIYWRNSFSSPRYLNWNMFRKLKLSYNKNNIYFGENDSFFAYETEIESLMKVLQNIRVGAKVDNFVEKTVGIFNFLDRAVNFLSDIDNKINNNQESQNEQLAIGNGGYEDGNDAIIEVSDYSEVEDLSQWTIAGKDIKVGPYTTEKVKVWLNSNKNKYGKLYIWKNGMENWELINNVPEFKSYVKREDNMPPVPKFD